MGRAGEAEESAGEWGAAGGVRNSNGTASFRGLPTCQWKCGTSADCAISSRFRLGKVLPTE